jgi:hypothetical protein
LEPPTWNFRLNIIEHRGGVNIRGTRRVVDGRYHFDTWTCFRAPKTIRLGASLRGLILLPMDYHGLLGFRIRRMLSARP